MLVWLSVKYRTGRGSSVGCVSASCASGLRDRLRSVYSFVGIFRSSADSRRASCQAMAKEWALNIGKLPPEGFPRNSVVK